MGDMITQSIPHDQEAEQAILGSIFFDSSVIGDVLIKIKSEFFYLVAHQHIFSAIVDLYKKEKGIDEILVADVLKSKNQLEEAGGLGYIGSLIDCSPEVSNIKGYLDIVSDHYHKRELIQLSNKSNKISRNPGSSATEVISESLEKITALSDSLHQKSELKPVKEIIIDVFSELEKVSENQDEIIGYATGFTDLDRNLLGLHDSDLVVLAARPSMGKTALALNIGQYIASRVNNEKDVLVFSYEMDRNQLVMRMAASLAMIDSKKIRTGNLDQDEWDKMALASDEISRMPLYIDDSIPTLEKMVSISKNHSKKNEISTIIVDYIQMVPLDKKGKPREQEVSEISRTLKLLAKQINCNVLALSQLNRSLENRGDKRPKLSDLRESGAIEQDADIIMFIYRDEVYNEDSPDKGTAEILIEKHRNGPTGKVVLQFIGKYTKFANLTDSYDQQQF